jgi:multiple sugar transport system permease protein
MRRRPGWSCLAAELAIATTARPLARLRARRRLAPWLLAAPLVAGLGVIAIYPALELAALSLTKSSLGRPLAKWIGLDHYAAVLSDGTFLATLLRTVLFVLPVSFLELMLGVAIALLLHATLRSGRWLRSLVLLPLMTPPIMVATAWKLILAPSGGLLNGVLLRLGIVDQPVSFLGTMPWAFGSVAIADTWQWTPFIAILAYAALQLVPEDVLEAARLDGASPAKVFWKITLPILMPTLLAVFLLRVVMAFKLFDLVFGLTFGGPGFGTTVASFQIWRTALEQFDIGRAAAQTLVFAALVGIVTMPLTWLHRRSEARGG